MSAHFQFHRLFFTVVLLLLLQSLTAQHRAFYVSPDGDNGNTGQPLAVAWATSQLYSCAKPKARLPAKPEDALHSLFP
ncbi:MAG: hypothetical protein AB8H12_21670 [Lewinella sp.]